ncbi:MAG: hypothetical protein WD934_01740 [Gemmatimonadales bacterium]
MRWTSVVLGHGLRVEATPGSLTLRVMGILPPAGAVPPVVRLSLRLDPGLDGPAQSQVGVHRWLLFSGGTRGVVDSGRSHARLALGPHLLTDRSALRHEVVDPAVLFLLTARDRVPLHAAALAHGGRAVVLAGPSGVGKSTLAWMAAQAGITVLAEDVVYVARHPALRLWGQSRSLHLRPAVAARLGVSGGARLVQRSGVPKVAVTLPAPVQATAQPAGVVLLAPGRAGRLRELPATEVAAQLATDLAPGFDRFASETAELGAALGAMGAWQLEVDAHPEQSFATLHRLLQRLLP